MLWRPCLPASPTRTRAARPSRSGCCRKDRKPAAIRSPLPITLASYTFSGVLESEDKSETTVGGSSTVTVNAPPDPSATRSFSTTRRWTRAGDGNGNHQGQQLRWSGACCGDPAFRLHQPGRERPDRHAPVAVRKDPKPVSYTVTASDNPGSYTFSGVLESEDKSETTVGGSSTVIVRVAPAPGPRAGSPGEPGAHILLAARRPRGPSTKTRHPAQTLARRLEPETPTATR